MPTSMSRLALPLLFPLFSSLAYAQKTDPISGIQTIPPPNYDKGWCYFCSDDAAPPLCNNQCSIAVQRLCAEDLEDALMSVEKDCQLQYLPTAWQFLRNGARPRIPSEADCLSSFNGVLGSCGKDASQPDSGVNETYCTSSGGGGTYGWKDDGSPMSGTPRYVVHTKDTEQCGQAKAPWHQSDSVIPWNDDWVKPGDQVVLDTNPPAASLTAAIANLPAPSENPTCQNETCNIFDQPYYAHSPVAPWVEKDNSVKRHRIAYQGWSQQDKGQALRVALHERCNVEPGNWQNYANPSNPAEQFADFDLPSSKEVAPSLFHSTQWVSDFCWCVVDAIYDASGGISMRRDAFCDSNVVLQQTSEFAPVKKRGVVQEGMGMFREVRGTPEEARQKRDERQKMKRALRKRDEEGAYFGQMLDE